MPELPEVETVRRTVAPLLLRRPITGVDGGTFPGVMGPGGLDRSGTLIGRLVTRIDRRGKYLFGWLDDGTALVVHLRMTGQLVVVPVDEPPLRFQHLAVGLAGTPDDIDVPGDLDRDLRASPAELRFADQRKFGRVLHLDAAGVSAISAALGPEPLDPGFTVDALAAALSGRRSPVKNLLLDQRRVAGLGNIYVDEALFRAGIHPLQPAGSIALEAIASLRDAIVDVLTESLARRGTTFSSFLDGYGRQGDNVTNLRVYGRGRSGQPCPVCGTPLQHLVLSARSASWCPTCQPLVPTPS